MGYGSASAKIEVTQRINHDGEINRARYMPQTPSIIATKSTSSEVWVFDYTKYPSDPPSDGKCDPQLRLRGHNREGYGLDWSSLKPGWLASASDDASVCVWDVNAMPSEPGVVNALHQLNGHSQVVEVCNFHCSLSIA